MARKNIGRAVYDGACQYSVPAPFSTLQAKFSENQLKACRLSANIRHAYWYLFVSQKTLNIGHVVEGESYK